MQREEYMKELRFSLRGLSEAEIEDAVAYCEEYFDEAEDEQKAIEDLGSPAKFATQLRADAACKTSRNPEMLQKPRSAWKTFFMIMAGIFALPIALPLLLVAVILIFIFFLLIFIFLIVGVIVILTLFYATGATLVAAFTVANGVGDMLLHIGVSLLSLGIAILVVFGVRALMKFVIPSFIHHLSDFYERHKGGNKDEI